jgi:hypothetical protein
VLTHGKDAPSYFYQGQQTPAKPVECVLLWDEKQQVRPSELALVESRTDVPPQSYILHRLATVTRLGKAKGALPPLPVDGQSAAKKPKLASSAPPSAAPSQQGTSVIPASCQASPDAIEEFDLGGADHVTAEAVPMPLAAPTQPAAPVPLPAPTRITTKAKPKPKAKAPVKPKAAPVRKAAQVPTPPATSTQTVVNGSARSSPLVNGAAQAAGRHHAANSIHTPHSSSPVPTPPVPQRAMKGMPRPAAMGGGGKGRAVMANAVTKKRKRRTDQIDISSGESSSGSDIGGGGDSSADDFEPPARSAAPKVSTPYGYAAPPTAGYYSGLATLQTAADDSDDDDFDFTGVAAEIDAHLQAKSAAAANATGAFTLACQYIDRLDAVDHSPERQRGELRLRERVNGPSTCPRLCPSSRLIIVVL